jgi:hypothetical protein
VGEEFHAASAILHGKCCSVAVLGVKTGEELVESFDAQCKSCLLDDPGEAGVTVTPEGIAGEVGGVDAEDCVNIPPGLIFVKVVVHPFDEKAQASMSAALLEFGAVAMLRDVLDGALPVVDDVPRRWIVVRR